MDLNIGIILLAAGASRRLGQPKQLLSIDGQSLLRRSAEAALGIDPEVAVVVLGAHHDLIAPELAGLPLQVVVNPNWATGMASSLHVGLAAVLAQQPSTAAVLILLCDQPLLTAEVLQQLVAAFGQTGGPIVASRYANGVLGVPILFSQPLFPELRLLTGDAGARKLLAQWPDLVQKVDFPEGLLDVDTPEDWAMIQAQLNL